MPRVPVTVSLDTIPPLEHESVRPTVSSESTPRTRWRQRPRPAVTGLGPSPAGREQGRHGYYRRRDSRERRQQVEFYDAAPTDWVGPGETATVEVDGWPV